MSVKQPYIECSNEKVTDANSVVNENLKVSLEGNKISKIEVIKSMNLDKRYINSISYSLENAYKYLGNKASIERESDKIIVKITVDKNNETILLNDIDFYNNDGLQIDVESNTKSSDVVTLSINDKYSEGDLLIRMKNNGYRCK